MALPSIPACRLDQLMYDKRSLEHPALFPLCVYAKHAIFSLVPNWPFQMIEC